MLRRRQSEQAVLSDFSEPKPLSAEIEQAIAESAERFESRFSAYRMLIGSQLPAWVEEYKEELRALARKCSAPALASLAPYQVPGTNIVYNRRDEGKK